MSSPRVEACSEQVFFESLGSHSTATTTLLRSVTCVFTSLPCRSCQLADRLDECTRGRCSSSSPFPSFADLSLHRTPFCLFALKTRPLTRQKGDEMRKSKSYDHMNGRESWGQIGSALKPLLRVARPSLSADEGRVAEKEKKKKDDCKLWQSMRAAKRLIMRVADVISLP